MKTKTIVALAILIALAVTAVILKKKPAEQADQSFALPTEQQTAISTPADEPQPEVVAPTIEEAAAVNESVPETASEFVPVEPVVAAPQEPARALPSSDAIVFRGESFAVKSDLVLAKVNNTKITLKDLVPVSQPQITERTLSAAEFNALLQRAIDREVVLNTARKNNVQLDEEQRRQVEKSRLSAAAKGFSLPESERAEYEAKSNFESLELLSTLMGDALVKAAGGPAKDTVTEEEYQKYVRGLLNDLRQENNINVNAVVE